MRFAYIDSHGNEVPIPSVDALALRIELGAIAPETQLYDAQADRWGPATSHEIFHTLARDSKSDGFVAPPPPPVAPPPPPGPAAKAPAKPKPEPEPVAEVPTSAADFGLTLAPPPPEPPKKASPPSPAGGALDLALDLAPPMGIQPPSSAPDLGLGGPGEGSVGGTFEYGDLGSGLELDDVPMDLGASPPGGGGGMILDAPMQFGGSPAAGAGDLQLEQPMSAFEPDSPPGWMSGPSGSDTLEFSAAPAEAEKEAPRAPAVESPARQRRAPKDRPSAPKFRSQRSLAGPIITVVILLALGVGGYVGWPLLQARLDRPGEPVRPAVVMPSIPAELLPTMRSLAEGAVADAVSEVDAATTTADTPLEPDQRWLGGQYLSDASQYGSVATFWSGMGAFMQGVRAADWQLYHDKMVARAAAQGIAADTVALLVERADSGFVAAVGAREATYSTMDRLVEAALGLHEFLVANEANIEYRPANSSTADPILEAVPSSTALGDAMLERLDRITEALAELGSLDRVTRQRLTAALTTRLQQSGIQ